MKRFLSLLLIILILSSVIPAFAADPILVESISLNQTSASIPINKSITLKATIEPKNASNKKLTWTSSDESIATVKNGQVKGKSVGTVTITATAQDESGASVSAEIIVVNPVKKIVPDSAKLILPPNIDWEIFWTVEPEDATNKEIEWISSNEKIATVNEYGVISTHTNGNCAITGTAKDGSKVKVKINVQVKTHDLIIQAPGNVDVEFDTEEYSTMAGIQVGNRFWGSKWERKVKVQNGCVTSPSNRVLVPVKSGSDTITITELENNRTTKKEKHTVFVTRSAVGESTPISINENTEELLFLGLPWGISYPQAQDFLAQQGKSLKALAQRNDYLRSMFNCEIVFANYTATDAAMNFFYVQGDTSFEVNNYLYKGDLYFDPEIPFENIRQAVRSVYKLDEGQLIQNKCTWEHGNVQLVLTKKERFILLEIIKDPETIPY